MSRKILTIHDDLIQRLEEMDNPIAEEILSVYVDTNEKYIDYLGISEDNSEYMSYLNGDRINKMESSMYWVGAKRYHTKPSKVVELLFPRVYSDREKELFTMEFRNEVLKSEIDEDLLTIVSGDCIADYYHQNSYAQESTSDKSSLWGSCMCDDDCDGYFGIYTHNHSVIKMALIKNEQGEVRARCLIWHIDGKIYYDRIYANSNTLAKTMQAALELKGYTNISPKNFIAADEFKLKVKLKNVDFHTYPYIDTMCYMNFGEKMLYSYKEKDCDRQLQSTCGSYTPLPELICDDCHDAILGGVGNQRTIVAGIAIGETLCMSCSNFSEFYNGYIASREAVYSRRDGWILEQESVEVGESMYYGREYMHRINAVELYNGQYAHKNDIRIKTSVDGMLFLEGDVKFTFIRGEYYNTDSEDVIKLKEGLYYLKGSKELERAEKGEIDTPPPPLIKEEKTESSNWCTFPYGTIRSTVGVDSRAFDWTHVDEAFSQLITQSNDNEEIRPTEM